MLIVIRVMQAIFMLAALACGIGAVAVVGGLVNDTETACHLTDDPDDEDGVTTGCATIPSSQVQATVGVTYALASAAMMIGAVAMNGMARPAGSTSTAFAPARYVGSSPTGSFTQQSSNPFTQQSQTAPPSGPPPQQPPPHPGQHQPPR